MAGGGIPYSELVRVYYPYYRIYMCICVQGVSRVASQEPIWAWGPCTMTSTGSIPGVGEAPNENSLNTERYEPTSWLPLPIHMVYA